MQFDKLEFVCQLQHLLVLYFTALIIYMSYVSFPSVL